MKNIETPDKKHLSSILEELGEGRFAIPDFQRDFEWRPWDVSELLKSVFEDYYIGTLLFWNASENSIDYLSCKPVYGVKNTNSYKRIVLDGQQRLSALYYAFFAPDVPFPRRKSRFLYIINIVPLLNGDFDNAFTYINFSKKALELVNYEELQFEQKILPLKLLGKSQSYFYDWLDKYQQYWIDKGNKDQANAEKTQLRTIIADTLNEYFISFIELDREIEINKVCDIFQRINSTGLDLNIFDLMNALLRPKEIRLKSMWENNAGDFKDALPDRDKGKIYALQTMSIVIQTYCAPKYLYYLVPNTKKKIKKGRNEFEDIVLIKSKDEFVDLWQTAVNKMLNSLKKLTNHSDFGIINSRYFPYPTMLPIFTAVNIAKEEYTDADKKVIEDKIRYWYWSSIFTQNYSSSVESQMAKDYIDLKKWFKDDNAVPKVVQEARDTYIDLDLKGEDSKNSAIYKAIFGILIREGAADFESYEEPLYSELNDHHIIPQSWGKKYHIKHIDSILNKTPLSDRTNKHIIRDKLPNTYMTDMLKRSRKKNHVYDMLETHLIDKDMLEQVLIKKNFSPDDFNTFLTLREQKIKEKIKALIGTSRME